MLGWGCCTSLVGRLPVYLKLCSELCFCRNASVYVIHRGIYTYMHRTRKCWERIKWKTVLNAFYCIIMQNLSQGILFFLSNFKSCLYLGIAINNVVVFQMNSCGTLLHIYMYPFSSNPAPIQAWRITLE